MGVFFEGMSYLLYLGNEDVEQISIKQNLRKIYDFIFKKNLPKIDFT